MDGIYISLAHQFNVPKPDVQAWFEIYKIFQPPVFFVDRAGKHLMPFNHVIYPGQELPDVPANFTKTYEQCCDERAAFLIQQSRDRNLPIYVMYSGGIDSTMVMVSLMKNMTEHELRNNVVVLLTQDSINENPNFYYNHIRKKCRIASSEQTMSLFDKRQIIVDGEFNDQIMGANTIVGMLRHNHDYDFNQPYTRKEVVRIFQHLGMTNLDHINRWVDMVDSSINMAPCEVKTIFQFFWWFNFNFKWQSVHLRQVFRADPSVHEFVDHDLIDNYLYHFFNTPDFQIWSMTSNDMKIRNIWNTYKFHAKELIYAYNGDADYRDHKLKCGSLFRLFLSKRTPAVLDTDLKYIYNVNQPLYYNPNNFFA